MNFTNINVNSILKRVGLEMKPPRTDGVVTIKRNRDGKVVAAYHPITRKFWIKTRSKQGRNGDFELKSHPITTENDLRIWGQEALVY